jgi:hypothetical protein
LVTFLYQDKKVTGVRGNAPFKEKNFSLFTVEIAQRHNGRTSLLKT